MDTQLSLSKDRKMFYALVIKIFCTAILVAAIMYSFNDYFRNPKQMKSLAEWKQLLKNNPDKEYLELLKISLSKSLEDPRYLTMSDSALVKILSDAKVVEIQGSVPKVVEIEGAVPKVQSENVLKGSNLKEEAVTKNYFVITNDDVYVLVADENYVVVWGKRPIKVIHSKFKQKIAMRTAENFSAVFYFLSSRL